MANRKSQNPHPPTLPISRHSHPSIHPLIHLSSASTLQRWAHGLLSTRGTQSVLPRVCAGEPFSLSPCGSHTTAGPGQHELCGSLFLIDPDPIKALWQASVVHICELARVIQQRPVSQSAQMLEILGTFNLVAILRCAAQCNNGLLLGDVKNNLHSIRKHEPNSFRLRRFLKQSKRQQAHNNRECPFS
jgi:hypothetical protein